MHDIPVFDNIVLALQAQFGFGLGLRHAAQFEQILAGDHFRPDEALLDIRVDLAGRLPGCRTSLCCPGPHFVLPDGEEGLLVEQVVRNLDHPAERQFGDAVLLHENGGILSWELGDLHFKFAL